MGELLITPLVVTLPIAFGGVPIVVNHILPAGPSVMSAGWLLLVSPCVNSLMTPLEVILPIACVEPASVNHRARPGPGVMPSGSLPAGNWNSLIAVACAAGTAALIASATTPDNTAARSTAPMVRRLAE